MNRVAVTAALITLCFSWACSHPESESERVQQALSDTLTQTTESWNTKVELFEDARKKVTVESEYALSRQDPEESYTTFKDSVHVVVWDSVHTGQIQSHIYCDRATFNAKEYTFECFGGVVIKTHDSKKLRSEYIHWNQRNNNIKTDRFVVITTPSDSITGYGMVGKTDLSTYTINKVTGSIETD